MPTPPDISVVMGVYNGGSLLAKTVDSILKQTGVSFEFIIVDDGSTDETESILSRYAKKNSRIKLFKQQNHGLTHALIRACSSAQGRYIARQDVGDESFTTRLEKQQQLLDDHENVVFVACNFEVVGPGGEIMLSPAGATTSEIRHSLRFLEQPLIGPHHGTTMFRRGAYNKTGGYRNQFYVAQDLDLWCRLIEVGEFDQLDDILYRSTYQANSISARYTAIQNEAKGLIKQLAHHRRSSRNEEHLLNTIRELTRRDATSDDDANSNAAYFIGSCLLDRKDSRATQYLYAAAQASPLQLKYWSKYWLSRLNKR